MDIKQAVIILVLSDDLKTGLKNVLIVYGIEAIFKIYVDKQKKDDSVVYNNTSIFRKPRHINENSILY